MRQPRQHNLLTRLFNLARKEDLIQYRIHLATLVPSLPTSRPCIRVLPNLPCRN
jgi:hypothetical protein